MYLSSRTPAPTAGLYPEFDMPLFPREEPPKRGKSEKWDFVPVAPGEWFHAWLSGPFVEALTHRIDYTKPCRERITRGALACPLDHGTFPPEWRAWVPLWSETWRPICVLVNESMRDYLLSVKVWSPVVVSRGKAPYESVQLRVKTWAKPWGSEQGQSKKVADIERWLVHTLWKDQILSDFFSEVERTGTSSAPRCEKPKDATADDREAGSEELRKIMGGLRGRFKVTKPDEPPPLGEVLPPPSGNGKH